MSPSKTRSSILFLGICAVVCITGCPPKEEPPRQAFVEPPRIVPEGIPQDVPLKHDPESLPQGARAFFPAFDGDTFFVSLPDPKEAEELSWEEVFNQVVTPSLRAIGFERLDEIMIPKGKGVEQPRAKLDTSPTNPRLEEFSREDVERIRQLGEEGISRLVEMGEGMTLQQYIADIERLEIQYPFLQAVGNVPIEHTTVLASRWEGETVTSITGRVFNQYVVANEVKLSPSQAATSVLKALRRVNGITGVGEPPERVELLLLPYGVQEGLAALRYSYRMPVQAQTAEFEGIWFVWLDAETASILELQPLVDTATARGRAYRRAPDLLPQTRLRSFQVDAASGGQYTLQRSGVFDRLDFQDDGYNASDVSISDSTNGSSATLANFDQATSGMNDAAAAVCNDDTVATPGADETFQQVHFFATLSTHYRQALNAGIYTPFPTSPWDLRVEVAGYCNGNATMKFGVCNGYFDPACPDVGMLNFAHDNTWIGHELAHNITGRQYTDRPMNWCLGPELDPGTPATPCPTPTGNYLYHDFADAWSAQFENTNCWSGWGSKNEGGIPNGSLNCVANTSEAGWSPRLHQVTVPFNAATPGDHFPEHRSLGTSGYADGQIAAAALWEVREGMRSKCRPSGTPQYGVRFMRTLRTTGWFGVSPGSSDQGIFRGLLDLEVKLLNQWFTAGTSGGPPAFKHNGPHTANKVTSGFARAGIFVIPHQCIDGNTGTSDPMRCPGGELGADAVIDIDDNDPADDPLVEGITHPEVDYLEKSGPPPTFHVWTGPRYQFSGGSANFPNPSLCNSRFRVQVANDSAFTVNLFQSGMNNVDRDPTTPNPECYGTWSPSPGQWNTLKNGGDRIYYRVTSSNPGNADQRTSTQPGNGLFTFPPPYAIINDTGTPAGCAVARFEHLGGTATQRGAALVVMWLPLAVLLFLRRRAARNG